jgi:guanine deaminase
MLDAGIRARIGKLSMDISTRPTYVEASPSASLEAAEAFAADCCLLTREITSGQQPLVEPVLTPRFVPTCSDGLLSGLGVLSSRKELHVQSHLAEAHDQVEWVKETRGKDDIDVFDNAGLLTSRTLQAHCTYLTPPDLVRVAQRGTSVAHCPLSNIYFSAKPFPLREALRTGVKIGLGTDIAGGYSADIMSAMRNAVAVSRMREGERVGTNSDSSDAVESLAITWVESLYLATRGGAIALGGKWKELGVFRVGIPFDAQQSKQVTPSWLCLGVGNTDDVQFLLNSMPRRWKRKWDRRARFLRPRLWERRIRNHHRYGREVVVHRGHEEQEESLGSRC